MERGLFNHLSPSVRRQYGLNTPKDLFEQAQRIAYKPFISRLPPDAREEFIAMLNLKILEKWVDPETTFDPRKGAFSNWVYHRARGVATTSFRSVQFDLDHNCQMFTPSSYYDGEGGPRAINEDWMWNHVQSKAVYRINNPLSSDQPQTMDELLDAASAIIPLSDVERDVLTYRMKSPQQDIITYDEIASTMKIDITIARKAGRAAQIKLAAIAAIDKVRVEAMDEVDESVREHENLDATFPDLVFDVRIESMGSCGSFSGIGGVRKAIELSHGAQAVGKRIVINAPVKESAGPMIELIRRDYGRVVRHCSRLKVSPSSITGVITPEEPGADIVWGLIMADVCNNRTMRSTAAFDPTPRDFAMVAANMRAMKVADDPVFAAAVRSWERRL
jgi:hypothetical protein